MTLNEYQQLAGRTNDGKSTERLMKFIATGNGFDAGTDVGGVVMASFGLCGEAGEYGDMIKKIIFHGTEPDIEHIKKELGDIAWYLANAAASFGWTLEEVMDTNVAKLKERYPDGFSEYLSNHRAEGDI